VTGAAAATATIGVDVGGTKLLAVLVGADGTVLAQRQRLVPQRQDPLAPRDRRLPTAKPTGGAEPVRDPTGLVDAVAEEVGALVQRAGDHRVKVVGVGVGLPGLVGADGRLAGAPHLPEAVGADIAGALGTRTGLPVVVDNDATCAALAEWRLGAGRGRRDVLLVTVGTGIGAGLVVGGAVARGALGFAGEAGHMVMDPTGPPCPCGRRGCWERYASGDALGEQARRIASHGGLGAVVARAGGQVAAVRGEHVTDAAMAGDPEATAVLRSLADWLALGLANLLALLDSELVILAGGLAAAGSAVAVPVAEQLGRKGVLPADRPPVPVVVARFGPAAGAVGAARLALEARLVLDEGR